MKAATTFALSALALLPFVSAHGYVSQVTIDGTSYKGNTPGSSSGEYLCGYGPSLTTYSYAVSFS